MLIEQYIVDIRRQLTGETLRGARLHLAGLRDWSEPVPAAKDNNQARLESHLLHALGQGQGRHPLGVSEVVPTADQVVLRLESVELFTALLPLLPYKDRRRSRHGAWSNVSGWSGTSRRSARRCSTRLWPGMSIGPAWRCSRAWR